MSCCGPADHQASTRDRWWSALNSTLMPGDSGSTLTSKPGLGVAHRTSTPDDENEIAAVPPVSVNVCVVAAAGVALDGAIEAVSGTETDVEVGEVEGGLVTVVPASVLLAVGNESPPADTGATTWLSTTDTPAQATPTAAVQAASHIEKSMSFFMRPVSRIPFGYRVNATLNEP
jgi:hypothetical protein